MTAFIIKINSRFIIFGFFVILILSGIHHQSYAAKPKIIFSNSCVPGQTLTIAAVGDILLHRPLQEQGVQQGFQTLWQNLIPYFRQADITYANLEGPIAAGLNQNGKMVASSTKWDPNIYSDYPAFNYHPSLTTAIKNSGIDIVSTANNHALDRNSSGIDKTLGALTHAGILFTGTRSRGHSSSFYSIVERKNFKIAWIACTEHTNGIGDSKKQVLYCFKKKDKQVILNTIQSLKQKVDAIIVTPHFGDEYETHPNAAQIAFAHQVLDAGALIVIGSHPHVLQPMERYLTKDGRQAFVIYSLGNFVSFQGTSKKRTSILLFIGLSKTPNGAVINGVKYVPLYMNNGSKKHLSVEMLSPTDTKQPAYPIISHILPIDNAINPASYQLPACLN